MHNVHPRSTGVLTQAYNTVSVEFYYGFYLVVIVLICVYVIRIYEENLQLFDTFYCTIIRELLHGHAQGKYSTLVTYVAVPDGNQILFHHIFRAHHHAKGGTHTRRVNT